MTPANAGPEKSELTKLKESPNGSACHSRQETKGAQPNRNQATTTATTTFIATLHKPTDLLQEAKGALSRPVIAEGGPVSILVTLREWIDAVVTELVRRRPKREKIRGWSNKIVSVGTQCARSALPIGHFDRLGIDAETPMNQLLGPKQADMERSELAEFFNRGLLFLNALMDSIDESRLR